MNPPRWPWAAVAGVLLKDWGEATAVAYSPHDATTHRLSAEAADVLATLMRGTATDGPPPDALLEALFQAGLVRPRE